jgi:REP element-mobilizing transposase RayT
VNGGLAAKHALISAGKPGGETGRGNRAGKPRPYGWAMAYDPEKHHRRSIRLPQYDYSQSGVYFVTICTHEHECMLGEIVDGVMILHDWGIVANQFWDEVAVHFPGIAIDAHVIMPNHTHVNLVIVNQHPRRGEVSSPASSPAAQGGKTPPLRPTLGQIVAYYKYQTTKSINLLRGMPGEKFWQRNYWEHVIRNEAEMNRIREYIETNPARWSDDQLHPAAQPNRFNLE